MATVLGSPVLLHHPSPFDWAYLAGVIDGEGSILIRDRSVRVRVVNTNYELVHWIAQHFRGAVYTEQRDHPRKRSYTWVLAAREPVRELLREVRPWLIVKADRADQALELIKEIQAA